MNNHSPPKDDLKWYAVMTRSRHEEKIITGLELKKIHGFLPKIEVLSSRKDRKKKILKPLFPGYLFVECEMSSAVWLNIVKIPGVVGLLGFVDGKAASIPFEQIESIKKIVDAGYIPRPHPYINSGDKVILKGGALNGAVGFFERINNQKGKLVVTVDILGRSVEVDVEDSQVEKF